ncbi:hypothetical protein BKA64DRAFT_144678 [Cadophora sp. MPI-SDFR-AT-0126]|nr:hypothetical protein BKA64DRAFT_144678 [Leotiomycetes sp. MPI-SDFR-AT-0126]
MPRVWLRLSVPQHQILRQLLLQLQLIMLFMFEVLLRPVGGFLVVHYSFSSAHWILIEAISYSVQHRLLVLQILDGRPGTPLLVPPLFHQKLLSPSSWAKLTSHMKDALPREYRRGCRRRKLSYGKRVQRNGVFSK